MLIALFSLLPLLNLKRNTFKGHSISYQMLIVWSFPLQSLNLKEKNLYGSFDIISNVSHLILTQSLDLKRKKFAGDHLISSRKLIVRSFPLYNHWTKKGTFVGNLISSQTLVVQFYHLQTLNWKGKGKTFTGHSIKVLENGCEWLFVYKHFSFFFKSQN